MSPRPLALLLLLTGWAAGAAEAPERAVAFGDDLRVEGRLSGDAVAYRGDVEVLGAVEGDATAFGGDLIIRGTVTGDAHTYFGNVVLVKGGEVKGRVTAVGGEVIRSSGAAVGGAVAAIGGTLVTLPDSGVGIARNASVSAPALGKSTFQELLLRFFVIFALAFLVRTLFPFRIDAMAREVRGAPLRLVAAGALALVALFPISVVLASTGVGVLAAAVLWFVFFAAVAVGAAAVTQAVGRLLPGLRRRRSQTLALAAGSLALAALVFVSWLAWVIYALVAIVGAGAVLTTRFGRRGASLPLTLRA